jgi:hypothetical protein
VAHVFEEACRQFVARGAHPTLAFRPVQVGSWWSADSSEEVDVVALDGQGGLLVGECKWGRADSRDLDRLMRRGGLVVADAGAVDRVTTVLFSAGGLRRGRGGAGRGGGGDSHPDRRALCGGRGRTVIHPRA